MFPTNASTNVPPRQAGLAEGVEKYARLGLTPMPFRQQAVGEPPGAEEHHPYREREPLAGRLAPRPAISAVGEWDRERDAAVRRGLQLLAEAGGQSEWDTEQWPRARQMMLDAIEGAERCNQRAFYQPHLSDCGGTVYLAKPGMPCHGFAHEQCVVSRVKQELRKQTLNFKGCYPGAGAARLVELTSEGASFDTVMKASRRLVRRPRLQQTFRETFGVCLAR